MLCNKESWERIAEFVEGTLRDEKVDLDAQSTILVDRRQQTRQRQHDLDGSPEVGRLMSCEYDHTDEHSPASNASAVADWNIHIQKEDF